MADLSITASDVRMLENAIATHGKIGEAVNAGEPVRRLRNVWYVAEAGDTEEKAEGAGIAAGSGLTGDQISICIGGDLYVGAATATENVAYGVSATKGKVAPLTDLATNQWVSPIAFGKSATTITVKPQPLRRQTS